MISPYFQSTYCPPLQVQSSFSAIPNDSAEKVQEYEYLQLQLQQDGEDLFFNQPDLLFNNNNNNNHHEDSYFGSHISYDHFHDYEDEDFHGLLAIDLNQQAQQLQQSSFQQANPITACLNESNKIFENNNNNNSNVIQNNGNIDALQKQQIKAIERDQCCQQDSLEKEDKIISDEQQLQLSQQQFQLQKQYYSQKYPLQTNAQQFSNYQSCVSSFQSQTNSTHFSCQQTPPVQYITHSPINQNNIYEKKNNALVNKKKSVKGNTSNNGNQQNVKQCSTFTCSQSQLQQINYQAIQQMPIFQTTQQHLQRQQFLYHQYQSPYYSCQQQQQKQIQQQQQQPNISQCSEEQSFYDYQMSSVLNCTENGCDETTSDMHLNDDHHQNLPLNHYIPLSNSVESQNYEKMFEFFGHNNNNNQDEAMQQEQQQLFPQKQELECQGDCNIQCVNGQEQKEQQNNNLPSMSSSHTLPINSYEQKRLQQSSDEDEHDFSNHHMDDDDDDEDNHEDKGDCFCDNKAVSQMELIADDPHFYTEQRKVSIAEQMQKSNKKNVVRNLMRAFKQYFLNRKTSNQIMRLFFNNQNVRDVQQKFKRYFTQRKFNHHSIKQLVQHEKYGVVFHQFLKEHSQTYLKNSSVKMQELHQVFIDFLLLCFKDIDLLHHLETYSKIKNPFQ